MYVIRLIQIATIRANRVRFCIKKYPPKSRWPSGKTQLSSNPILAWWTKLKLIQKSSICCLPSFLDVVFYNSTCKLRKLVKVCEMKFLPSTFQLLLYSRIGRCIVLLIASDLTFGCVADETFLFLDFYHFGVSSFVARRVLFLRTSLTPSLFTI